MDERTEAQQAKETERPAKAEASARLVFDSRSRGCAVTFPEVAVRYLENQKGLERGENVVYSYKVVEIREKMIGGKMSGDKLEKLLNDHAKQGWRLRTITAVDVKGRVGPGGVEGVLVTFERGG